MLRNKTLWITLLVVSISLVLFFISMSFYGRGDFHWLKAFKSSDDISVNSISINTYSLIIVGVGLSISGIAMQGVTRNLLASSYSLGTVAISTLAIIIVNNLFSIENIYLNIFVILLLSIFFSTLVLLITFSKNVDRTKVIIIGMIISTFVFAITYIFEKIFKLTSSLSDFLAVSKLMGSWKKFYICSPLIGTSSLALLFLSRRIHIFTVDPMKAKSLGINYRRLKISSSFFTIVSSTSAVFLMGPIAFVGILIPFLSRALLGKTATTGKTMLLSIPLSIIIMLLGGILTRYFFKWGATLNVLISLVSGPIVLYMVLRSDYA